MFCMKFKQNVVEQFLWESYNIDSWKYLIKILEESDESKIKEIGKNVIIQHSFQIRRAIDPGFRYYILDRIKNDKSALKMAEYYIEKLLLDGVHFDECKTFNPNPKNDCIKNLPEKTVNEDIKHIPVIEIYQEDRGDGFVNFKLDISDESSENDLKTSIEYFNQRYEMAREEGDELTANAIKNTIYEYETGMFSLYDFNKRQKFYWENVNKEVNFDLLRYNYESITFMDNYLSTSPSDFLYTGNIISLMGLLEFEDSLLNLLERFDIPTASQRSERIHDLNYIKFLKDAFSIASIIWFNSLNLKDKEKLLNGNYNLNSARVTELIDKFEQSGSENIYPLRRFALECFQNGFFDIAGIVYEYIYNHSNDMHTKSECMDKIGDIHREKMDYNLALEYYKKAYEHAYKIQTTKRVRNNKNAIEFATSRNYVTAIESLRVAEMEYMLGQIDVANLHISEVQDIAQKANIDEKLSIFWNIACTFKRTGQYEKEYRCLDEIAELGEGKRNDLVVKADKRLLFLNSFLNDINFKLDDEILNEYEIREKKYKILKVIDLMKKSFQFEREIEYIKNILNVENDTNLQLELAFCYYKLKKMDFAKLELNRAIDDTEKPEILVFCHLYLAFIHFKHKKNDNGYIEFEKSIKCGILSGKIDEIIQHCIFRLLPLKKQKLLKQTLERLLNIVETEYSNEDFISLVLRISRYLLKYGVVNDAVYFAEIGIEKSGKNPELNVKSLRNIAGIYSIIEGYEKSVEYLKRAASINPKLPDIWLDMADAYTNMFDFKCAEKCVDKALDIKPENEKYKILKEEYNELSKDNINFKKIKDEDVKNYFLSAERIILEFADSLDEGEFDFSLSLVSYGKGLETMLHNRISKPLRKKILKEYNGTPLADKYFYKYGPNSLPSSLRSILGIKEKTINLGSWQYILDDCNAKNRIDIVRKSQDYFAGKLNRNKEMIFSACKIISEYRNGAAHFTSKPKDEILNIRKEIIEEINKVVNSLYN